VTTSLPRAKIDSFDRKILRILSVDGRISWRTLADKINLTLTPTLRRVRRLEAEGYIKGYAAILDEFRLLGRISIVMYITMDNKDPEILENFEKVVVTFPEVIFCGAYSPHPDYMVNLYSANMDEAHSVIRKISSCEGVGAVESIPFLRISRHMKPLGTDTPIIRSRAGDAAAQPS
jgi:Lrp/AsnC family leucine-responsive transcriptional regulator